VIALLTTLCFVSYVVVLYRNVVSFNLILSMSLISIYGVTNLYLGLLLHYFSPYLENTDFSIESDEYSPVHVDERESSLSLTDNNKFSSALIALNSPLKYSLPVVYSDR